MYKIFSLIMATLLLIPLSACSLISNNSKNDVEQHQKFSQHQLDKNDRVWNQKLKDAKIETTSYGASVQYSMIPTSIAELKQYNKTLVKGTVFNLQQMTGCKDEAYTKVSLFVDEVIRGNKSIQNTIISFNLNSGFIDHPKQSEYDYIKKTEVPMPAIGSQLITGLSKRNINQISDAKIKNFFQTNQVANFNSYSLNDPVNSLWIKNHGDSKFHLNNPLLNKRSKDDWYANKLLKLTDKLNQIEN
ncbi:hypothetical protein [Companilactobacillus sp.]|uniref:hypothetical protein n=1 Tax=Companilactobacillus sp. TaxID=2767905 RepID=UPI0025C0A75A|nr:hypothetical protein [Companilactobacillus sp.]MCH4009176.1 hypothetical protein [Companilactobacillus sp.]MCH4050645.1 hypothetical protein [Companilactobacillus sp.]MCH4077118.1 hypothetical protein [Companilactobacillus sp.]MCH4125694.1 hypothetical protein [Companilactobacillus sp.]MCI1311403.1 hypothetical protein [Companilactobacillus sp.]